MTVLGNEILHRFIAMSVLYEKASHRHRLVIYPMDASEYKQLQLATQAPTRLMVHGMYIHLKQSQYQSV